MDLDQKLQVLTNCHLATMRGGAAGFGKVKNATIVRDNANIIWVGCAKELPQQYQNLSQTDLEQRWVLPAFVDCHTHLIYAGNRIAEFEQRLNGASYEQIAKAGGGIISTVKATRSATESELITQSLPRLQQMQQFGTGTIEIKSGYGLTIEDEIKMLRAARDLGRIEGVRVSTSLLGAHALPPEFIGQSDAYIDMVVEEMLPKIAVLGLADAVDVFCENIAFSLEQTKRVFEKSVTLGLPIRLHGEQLSNSHGCQMAAEMGALSCDHLEYLDEAGAKAMADAGTVAVLLPGAFYFLKETKTPPVNLLRKHGVAMAIATDCNPGSSPTTSLPLMLSMAVTFFGLTPDEALAGVTRNAAKALGLGQQIGQIAPGFTADLVAWDINSPAELCYGFGACPLNERV
ncbi:MAG: imidazolonepropionase [Robiginitomaculum sp.]|nr:imidazolonepropionase [Robiginitomaculum sp.]